MTMWNWIKGIFKPDPEVIKVIGWIDNQARQGWELKVGHNGGISKQRRKI